MLPRPTANVLRSRPAVTSRLVRRLGRPVFTLGVVASVAALSCSSSSTPGGTAAGTPGGTADSGTADAPRPTGLPDATSSDTGPGPLDSRAPEVGCPPGGRYTLVTPPSTGCDNDGSGRVLDTTTGLAWTSHSFWQMPTTHDEALLYCSSEGMRLPTRSEAQGIAGRNRQKCAFPCNWITETSTAGRPGEWWWVNDIADEGENPSNDPGKIWNTVLCVVAPGDAGAGDASNADAATPAGCAPGGRYEVQSAPTSGCSSDGTGRVRDTSTGLTWLAKRRSYRGGQSRAHAESYCAGLGMRLPTRDEALALAGANRETCAFPCGWSTWTSSAAGTGLAWHISYSGVSSPLDVRYDGAVLCVQ